MLGVSQVLVFILKEKDQLKFASMLYCLINKYNAIGKYTHAAYTTKAFLFVSAAKVLTNIATVVACTVKYQFVSGNTVSIDNVILSGSWRQYEHTQSCNLNSKLKSKKKKDFNIYQFSIP